MDSGAVSTELIREPAPVRTGLRRLLRALAAVVVTLAMFVVLPLTMLYEPSAGRELMVREVDTTTLLPPRPPPPRPLRPRPRPRSTRKRLRAVSRAVRPRRSAAPRPTAVHPRLPISLALSLPSMPTDLGLDFRVAPQPAEEPRTPAEEAAPGPLSENEVDQRPRPVAQPPPLYPYRARLHGIEGWVDVEFTVTEKGATTDLVVVEEHPPGVFGRAALEAVRRWRFKPGRQAGRPVPVRVRVRLRFQLRK